MSKLTMYQVDAFTDKLFEGNPAAVVIIEKEYPTEKLMMNIAAENNLSETAFILHLKENTYYIRWFTPNREHELCGHATLASGHVLFHELKIPHEKIIFQTKFSGILNVIRGEDGYMTMDFPTQKYGKEGVTDIEKDCFKKSFGDEIYKGVKNIVLGDLYWMIEVESKKLVLDCKPDQNELIKAGRAVVVTSKDEDGEYDFVSRMFAPWYGIPEDPVTGSAHTLLSHFWFDQFKEKKKVFKAKQLSSRTGELLVEYKEQRTNLSGKARTFLIGQIFIE